VRDIFENDLKPATERSARLAHRTTFGSAARNRCAGHVAHREQRSPRHDGVWRRL